MILKGNCFFEFNNKKIKEDMEGLGIQKDKKGGAPDKSGTNFRIRPTTAAAQKKK